MTTNPEVTKSFIQDLQNTRKRLEELDQLIINPTEGPLFDKELLNLYGVMVRQLCSVFRANTFHVFFYSPDDPTILDGVMTIRDAKNNVRLQFIRVPVDKLTLPGYTLIQGKLTNITDLYGDLSAFAELTPTRQKMIDDKLAQKTKESLCVPILNATTQKAIGAAMLCNTHNGEPFLPHEERGLQALASIIAKSHLSGGTFSRMMVATKNSGKAGYVTSLMQGQSGEESALSEEDFLKNFAQTQLNTNLLATAKEVQNAGFSLKLNTPSAQPPLSSTRAAQSKVDEDVPEDEKEDDDEDGDEGDDDESENLPSQASTARSKTGNDSGDEDKSPRHARHLMASPSLATFEKTVKQEEVASIKKRSKGAEVENRVTEAAASAEVLNRFIHIFPNDEGKHYESRYEYLVDEELIDEEDLKKLLIQANKDHSHADELLEKKFKIPLMEIGKSLSLFFNLPYFPFNERFDRPQSLVGNIKHEFFEKQQWLPVTYEEKPPHNILIVSPDPIRAESSSISSMLPRPQFKLYVTTNGEFQQYFNHFFGGDQMNQMLVQLESSQVDTLESLDNVQDSAISEDDLVKLVNRVIAEAYGRRASDIHIEPYPGNMKTVIRFRIDGELLEFLKLSYTLRSRIINRIKVMADMNISEQRIPQDGKIKMSRFVRGLDIELRVATYPIAGGTNLNLEDCVMRILASGEPIPMEKLGIREFQRKRLIASIEKPYGLAFVCGPTGSGKTTTLHSILRHLNTPLVKIVTAEDPVEITQFGLRQSQIDRKAGNTFATAMRSFLRADPDIIMVGEMRDQETAQTGIEASLTGHLVLSTLHTNSAPEAVTRLLEMGMEPLNFADALLSILAQRLAKRLCAECKQPYTASDKELQNLANEFATELIKYTGWANDPEGEKVKLIEHWREMFGDEKGVITLYKPRGCVVCNEGYKGRLGLHELMVGTDAIKDAIKNKARTEEILAICLSEGMDTLKMDGIWKVLQGDIDLKQVLLTCIK